MLSFLGFVEEQV